MKQWLKTAATLSLALAAGATVAQPVKVEQAWVRATVAQQQATGAFMRLTAATDGRLVEVSSPLAAVAEIHEMAMEGSLMKMRAIAALELPAGKAVELKAGGLHLMLMGLKKPIQAGDKVPLTLVFEGRDKKRQTVELAVEARALGAAAAPAPHKH